MGNISALLGEFGIPFDLDDKAAYRTGDFSPHGRPGPGRLLQRHRCQPARLYRLELHRRQHQCAGNKWNDEDLSIFSRDQQANPSDVNSGGRGLAAVARP
jgi:hypothetical protein